ncbi:unnamed protein product [Kuraishia capsulata CBS 1993]|uniref:Phosphotransferase n=1 Tax=Kuraishia capsulata CBS 1993 TaxID=1382522 RepID=W6MXM5_9ASCO|nr:uncharacterized protein KUCA_T00005137001 [Kuraishia capsulata CBS 1993]CDK29150.1 unnamed protein product [Kuraishia capsulata CBS 1993]
MTAESASLSSLSTPLSEVDSTDIKPQLALPRALDAALFFDTCARLSNELDEAVHQSQVSMLPGFTLRPKGNERGRFLVIDLGGSTLRICVVDLTGDGAYAMLAENSWVISDTEKVIDAGFFRMIATKAADTVGHLFKQDELVHTGITWSFPIEQSNPDNGVVNVVSKGYTLGADIAGQDLKHVFEHALLKTGGLHAQVDSIINDAVAVYVSGLYTHGCTFGLVLGTGINASISVPKRELGSRLTRDHLDRHIGDEVVLNAELSFFGSSMASHATPLDVAMHRAWESDLETFPAHLTDTFGCFQPLEFMCSGRYVSELVRLALVEAEIFSPLSKGLLVPYSLSGEVVCKVYESNDLVKSREIFLAEYPDLAVQQYGEYEYAIIRDAIDAVISRAALMLAAALVSTTDFIRQIHGSDSPLADKVGYVGSLLRHFKSYRSKVDFYLELAAARNGRPKVDLVHIDNSSVLGAAISAGSYLETI